MKKLPVRFFQLLSTVLFAAAVIIAPQWSIFYTYQPECPEEIVR
ncbi:MAG: cyclic lactone autoinducer peptide [Clostridiaceae bacterium]